jgi:hypothetical protein
MLSATGILFHPDQADENPALAAAAGLEAGSWPKR